MWSGGAPCKVRRAAAGDGSTGVSDASGNGDDYAKARRRLAEQVAREVEETERYTGRKALAPRVMRALERVPRHRFVPEGDRAYAYENRPLPIGHGQTISQPYIVALMTDLAEPGPGVRVLEVGTGCGYQAAMLAETGAEVYSTEVVPELAERAAETLKALGYDVRVRTADGSKGWPEAAPFDAIVVTAAGRELPPALVEQLAPGGRMVIPLEEGGRGWVFGLQPEQELVVVEKDADGRIHKSAVLPVAFVPLVGKRGR